MDNLEEKLAYYNNQGKKYAPTISKNMINADIYQALEFNEFDPEYIRELLELSKEELEETQIRVHNEDNFFENFYNQCESYFEELIEDPEKELKNDIGLSEVDMYAKLLDVFIEGVFNVLESDLFMKRLKIGKKLYKENVLTIDNVAILFDLSKEDLKTIFN